MRQSFLRPNWVFHTVHLENIYSFSNNNKKTNLQRSLSKSRANTLREGRFAVNKRVLTRAYADEEVLKVTR